LARATPASAADKTTLACIDAAEQGEKARSSANLVKARELFTRCAASDCPSVLRHDCTTWLDETTQQIPSVVVGARDANGEDVLDATATVDGVRAQDRLDGTAIELNPGPHVIRVEGSNHVSAEERVVIRAGEKSRTIVLTLAAFVEPSSSVVSAAPSSPAPSAAVTGSPGRERGSSGVPLGVYVFGGVGVAALGAFTYFGVRGKHDADYLRSTCAPACASSDVDHAHTELVVADVSLGVVVLAVAAATYFGIRALERPRDAAWDFVVTPTLHGVRSSAVLRF
jgi:hypothetical protein